MLSSCWAASVLDSEMGMARVLVVEDEPFVGELVCEILGIHGFEGRHVLLGLDGLAQAHELKPDAVVLDLMLPDVDGIEICRKLRQSTSSGSPAVVMLTGMHDDATKRNGFAAGADRFLTKPFRPEDLIDELQSVLAEDRGEFSEGLRRLYRSELSSDRGGAGASGRLSELLVRASPLCPAEIDAIAKGVRILAHQVRHADGLGTWSMTFSLYRDRMVTRLSCDGPHGAEACRWLAQFADALAAGTHRHISPLADESRVCEEDSSLELVRWYSDRPDGA